MKEYSLVIASNFVDHYMLALSLELMKYFKDFKFVASKELAENYRQLGFSDLNNKEFVVKAYENKKYAEKIIMDADIVITGSYAYENHINKRLKKNKPVIYYSERLFKYNKILNFASAIRNIIRYRYSKNSILLCISAYAAGDYNKINLFKNRTYKWGYFPAITRYDDIDKFINNKKKNTILWVGRLIEWKHPDHAIEVARRLKNDGYSFEMNIAGNGEMEDKLKSMISEYDLADCVHMLGSMPPEQIRKHMEESEIYLFTSDKGEGWGVVLNEAMNSACACVASYSAGSTPFLIQDKENGIVYKNQNVDDLYKGVAYLLDNDAIKKEFSKNAYETIANEWNCEETASRLSNMISNLLTQKDINVYSNGLLSKTEIFG